MRTEPNPRPASTAPAAAAAQRSYRCHYTPTDRDGFPLPSDSGVLPFVQLQAASAELAHRAAHALTGCPIDEVQRLEGGAA